MKHTPGPWYHEADSHTGAVKTGGKQLIASDFGDDPECNEDDRQIANARLIAAAPDLLAVCKAVAESSNGAGKIDTISFLMNLRDLATAARAAIAKATGR